MRESEKERDIKRRVSEGERGKRGGKRGEREINRRERAWEHKGTLLSPEGDTEPGLQASG